MRRPSLTAIATPRPSTADLALRAALLGIAAGSRAATPNAVLALRQPASTARWTTWVPYRWPVGRAAMVVGMLGEFVGDKLPTTPSRLQPGSLAGRVVSGTLAGAAIASDGGRSAIAIGALLGGAGAVAGSVGGAWARKAAVAWSGLPDLPIALLEDCAAVGMAAIATDRQAG